LNLNISASIQNIKNLVSDFGAIYVRIMHASFQASSFMGAAREWGDGRLGIGPHKFVRNVSNPGAKSLEYWEKFAKILAASSSRTFGYRKYLYEHELKAHCRASFTQNFKSLSIKMRELGLSCNVGRAVQHSEAKFVKILLANSSRTLGHKKYL